MEFFLFWDFSKKKGVFFVLLQKKYDFSSYYRKPEALRQFKLTFFLFREKERAKNKNNFPQLMKKVCFTWTRIIYFFSWFFFFFSASFLVSVEYPWLLRTQQFLSIFSQLICGPWRCGPALSFIWQNYFHSHKSNFRQFLNLWFNLLPCSTLRRKGSLPPSLFSNRIESNPFHSYAK